MDPPGMVRSAKWTKRAGEFLAAPNLIGNIIAQFNIPNDPFPFGDLPKDIQNNIIGFLGLYGSAQSLSEATRLISLLARANKFLNELINNPGFCRQLIKSLAKRFDCDDFSVSKRLKTQRGKIQHQLQGELLELCMNKYSLDSKDSIVRLIQLINQGVDVNFTYHEQESPALVIAVYTNPAIAFFLLDTPGIDPELSNKNGITPLIAAQEDTPNPGLIARIEDAINDKRSY